MQWHQLGHMQTVCTLLQTDNHTNTSALNFYRPDALSDAQPSVSKHWRHRPYYICNNKLHLCSRCMQCSLRTQAKQFTVWINGQYSSQLKISYMHMQIKFPICWLSGVVQRQLRHCWGELQRLLPNTNVLVAVSKGMQAAKLCTSKIL